MINRFETVLKLDCHIIRFGKKKKERKKFSHDIFTYILYIEQWIVKELMKIWINLNNI
jgi:hypothetical protein